MDILDVFDVIGSSLGSSAELIGRGAMEGGHLKARSEKEDEKMAEKAAQEAKDAIQGKD